MKKNQWHPGFCSAVQLELRENREDLNYTREYNLNRKPLQIDLLVIRKEKDAVIKNEIGKIFRGHNIMEYKSPEDELNLDVYFKTLAYACLYKSGGGHADAIAADDITISLVRDKKPMHLLTRLSEKKIVVEQASKGIYYIKDAWFAIQLIVTSELDKREHLWLCSLTKQLSDQSAKRLVYEIAGLSRKDEKTYADSVLAVAIAANKEIFQKMKEGGDMCQELRELMEPEIKEELEAATAEGREEGRAEGRAEGREHEIFSSVQDGDYDAQRGAQKLGISEPEFVARMEAAGYNLPECV